MGKLVLIDGSNAYTTSLIVAQGFSLEHRAIVKLIRTYQKDISDLSRSALPVRKFKTKGRTGEEYLLNEGQAVFLATLMKNSPKTVAFKKRLAKEFVRQRNIINNLINQRADPNWQGIRKDGKAVYLQKTDIIKKFAEYAEDQGSQSANKYYMAIANMENRALFFFEQKYKNLREVLTIRQLMQVATADQVVEKALTDGMERGLPYKECYKLAKERIIAYANIIGQSPVLELSIQNEETA